VQLGYSRGSEKGWPKTKTHFICKSGEKAFSKRAWRDLRIPTPAENKAEKSAVTCGVYEL